MTRVDHPHRAGETSEAEWLEADGLGGFASGTAGGERTRRYHALLLAATRPPTGRVVLVNGMQAWIESAGGAHYALTRHLYSPRTMYPDTTIELAEFDTTPWPTWRFRIDDYSYVTVEIFVVRDSAETVLRWRLQSSAPISRALMLHVRPLISGRDYHALHHENPLFDFTPHQADGRVWWRPYGDLPAIAMRHNGAYTHAPDWYRNFCYVREQERGLDYTEDLATPGVFSFDLTRGEAVMILNACSGDALEAMVPAVMPALDSVVDLADCERRRRAAFASRLERSADAYLVARGDGQTIIAGYPWFTDWGRDTFIAMRGLLLATGRYREAESILLEWTGTISEGMLPNRFPDDGAAPVYNAVDASLWFVVAVHEYLGKACASVATRERLRSAIDAILEGYARGTRFNIAADGDGLLRAGEAGVQLTWMDAKVGEWVVTPRIGKPVEVQALWINALRIALEWDGRWRELEARASASFAERFVNPLTGALYDVVDVDHEPGRVDAKIRPNQIFAVGGLPYAILDGERARAVVEQVETQLLTPLGLRSLAASDPDYVGRYEGSPLERDGAYHQGAVWLWLIGPFVEAWLRVQRDAGISDATRFDLARKRFLAPLLAHLERVGLDHLSEIADGDAPHVARGAPFQAWSLGELLRIERMLAA
ncbi:amylo-alpha-1,6-glucosidase [Trinickia sp. EG282A]|uniref:amylo-alpha-1,6-glucosidase n=1 Tax=Trinickia sp. EG282A TaxID=3237013 RepID=UPI0034D1A93A